MANQNQAGRPQLAAITYKSTTGLIYLNKAGERRFVQSAGEDVSDLCDEDLEDFVKRGCVKRALLDE